jgi:hypothetical protein
VFNRSEYPLNGFLIKPWPNNVGFLCVTFLPETHLLYNNFIFYNDEYDVRRPMRIMRRQRTTIGGG